MILSTLQMFTMLRVCKVLFIRHHRPVLIYILFSGLLISLTCIYFLCSCFMIFFFSFAQKKKKTPEKKYPLLNCDLTWLNRRYEWETKYLTHFYNWTWYTNMNMKRIHTGKQNIKIVKKIYVKLFSGNTVQQIKLCCNPLMRLVFTFCEVSFL